MTTDELNAIVQAVMTELEKAGVDFDFKAETPQADDLVYVMRGTADKYQGITVKWQNLLDIIVKKATDAKDEAVSAKDIALQTLATIQGIESNVSLMKSSVETTKGEVETLKSDVATMKTSVEASETNVTQMKSEVSEMKTSVEGTKTEVEGLKSDVTDLKAQTQTIVDNAKEDVTGLLNTKVDYTDSLTYEEIMATTDLTNKVASAETISFIKSNIKRGSISIPAMTQGGYMSRYIAFDTPFDDENYHVILSVSRGTLGAGYMDGVFSSNTKTKNGFNITVKVNETISVNQYMIDWLAIRI